MILGAIMRVLHTVVGIAMLVCPSTNGFMVASPLVRVPLGLHMTLSVRPVNALHMRQNKVKPLHTKPLKRTAKRFMSDVVSTPEEESKGFWGKVSSSRHVCRVHA